jgi:hypothetical protein
MHKSIFTFVISMAVAACRHSISWLAAFGSQGTIAASEMNGLPMPVRDKGPLWILHPYDAKPEYRTEAIYSKSIWQLSRTKIK